MKALHEVVRHWQGLDDSEIEQSNGTYGREPCCHGAHIVHYLTQGKEQSFSRAARELAAHLGGNEAQVILALRQAGAPAHPFGGQKWDREAVYARLLQMEALPSLEGADLRGADLEDANLRGADLRDAYLRDADLRGAKLEGAKLEG